MKCAQVRELFGAYWDDEITQAEREWIESHFAACTACREEYETYSRTLELVGSLPREEAAPDLLDRVTARIRRVTPSVDRLPVGRVAWVPITAAAALTVLVVATLSPWLRVATTRPHPALETTGPVATREPVRITGTPAVATERTTRTAARATTGNGAVATVADSLFDHAEDVEFILDPGTVRRGHVRPVSPRATSVQGERAVISF